MENKIKYGYDDINIVPEISSSIEHRSECKLEPFLFTAPMSSVVNLDNIYDFLSYGIIPIIPRNISLIYRKSILLSQIADASSFFIALSLIPRNRVMKANPIKSLHAI